MQKFLDETKSVVLIVDDVLENVSVLGEMLEGEGYEVRVASQGRKAIDIAKSTPLDLILLDIMMPELSGYEVCSVLKGDDSTADIPIIFLTALSDEPSEAKGLDLGAVDFIYKPFKMELVKKRVCNQIALSKTQRLLKNYSEHLEAEVNRRTAELKLTSQKVEQVALTKSLYLHLFSQELKPPVVGIMGIGQLALLEISDKHKRDRYQLLFDESKVRIDGILTNASKLVEVFSNKTFTLSSPVKVTEVLDEVIVRLGPRTKKAAVHYASDLSLIIPDSDFDLFVQAMEPICNLAILLQPEGDTAIFAIESSNNGLFLNINGNCVYDFLSEYKLPSELVSVKEIPIEISSLRLRLTLSEAIFGIFGYEILTIANKSGGFHFRIRIRRDP